MTEDFRGKLGGLEGEEFDAFLEGSYLARVACLTPDGAPYVIPSGTSGTARRCGSWDVSVRCGAST